MAVAQLAGIAAAWILYGALHSWLAGNDLKALVGRRWPGLMPAYRLFFNAAATVLLLPPLWLTWSYPGEALWHWPAWIAWPAAIAAIAGYLWSLSWYDGLDFLGIRQWRERRSAGDWRDRLAISPLHRYVRHPWYSLGLLFLWTRDLNAGWLVATLAITAYLVVGSRMEERKLIETFGEPYRRYRARVPALVPMPGHHLDREEAESLARTSSQDQAASPPSS